MVQGRPGLDVGQPSGRDRTPAGGRVQGARWRAQGAHSRKIKIKRKGPTLTGAGGQERPRAPRSVREQGGHKEGWTQGFILVRYKGQGAPS